MALSEMPSWLNRPDFLGASHAGAALGLQRRGQDLESSQAADRLRLAYDTLRSNEDRANEQAQARLEVAHSALAARMAAAESANELRRMALENAQARAEGLDAFRKQTLETAADRLNYNRDLLDQRIKQSDASQELQRQKLALDLERFQNRAQKLTPAQQMQWQLQLGRVNAARRAMENPIGSVGRAKAQSELDAALQDAQDFMRTVDTPAPGGSAMVTPAARTGGQTVTDVLGAKPFQPTGVGLTMPPNPFGGILNPAGAPALEDQFDSPDAVRAAMKTIGRAKAIEILKNKFGYSD